MAQQPRMDLFVDGVSDISMVNGMVRVDLFSFSATEKGADGSPQPEFRQRIVLSPAGFLETFGAMQGMVQRLQDAGLIRRKDDEEPAAEPKPAKKGRAKKADTEKPSSPNFETK